MRRSWLQGAALLAGLVLHMGTALLRLGVFFPYPRLQDFANFYVAAWSFRTGYPPHAFAPALLGWLRVHAQLTFDVSPAYATPVFLWAMQPFTWFIFPVSAWIWLILNGLLLFGCSRMLATLAGHTDWRTVVLIFLLAATYGPVFLTFTLGQNSLLILAALLVVGWVLRVRPKGGPWFAAGVLTVATVCKLYPLAWLAAFVPLRRWKALAVSAVGIMLVCALGFIVAPQANRTYWTSFLPGTTAALAEQASVEDQSVLAWLDHLGRPREFMVPGLLLKEPVYVAWSPPWAFDPWALRAAGALLLAALAVLPVLWLFRLGSREAPPAVCTEGVWYLWVLFVLTTFPHVDRYNHVLLLPTMAWLWGQKRREAVLAAYLLVGLSRLTHLWVMFLPAPWGPLAASASLYALLLLGAAVVRLLMRPTGTGDDRPREPARLGRM